MAREVSSAAQTTVTQLTPQGRGAIASLLVEGPRAWEIVRRLFHPAGSRQPEAHRRAEEQRVKEPAPDRILFGRWGSPAGEEVVVGRRSPSHVEIHCHGGQAASAAIVSSLERAGCRPLEWPAACEQSDGDRVVAQARVALAAARTERVAQVLLWQFNGALGRALEGVDRRIAAGDAVGALAAVRGLLARAPLGRHLVEPWRVVLAGRPNVGKSSLINALVGYSRSIVYDMPGTTRDVVTATSALDGWPVELSDTAGLDTGGDALERAGVKLAHEQVARADLVVLVFDATRAWSDDDEALADLWPGALKVYNKRDLLPKRSESSSSSPSGVLTSAISREGLPELEAEIARRLVPQPPVPGEAVPFTEDQIAQLVRVLALLERGEFPTARGILGIARPS